MHILYKISTFILLLAPFMVSAQEITPRVAGLERNEKYMSFLMQEKKLQHKEDSIVNIINETRKLFAAASPDKDKYGKEIVRLEGELFEVRNNTGIIVSSINAIEQEFIISNLSQGGGISPQIAKPDGVLSSDFIIKTLSETDQEMLKQANIKEIIPPKIIASYMENYGKMREFVTMYDTASPESAQDALVKFNTLESINKLLSDSLSTVWGEIYDDKMYLYGLLLDKMNKTDLLSQLETEFKDVNQRIASVRDKLQSEVVYSYPLQRKLLLSYEKVVWDQVRRTVSRDSVISLQKAMDAVSYDIPQLSIKRRVFIPYEDIKISVPSVYNASNSIPQNEVFDYGTVYKIDVGIFTRQQPVSMFRGASPLCYEKLEDGRYRYCIGAFRDQVSAQRGVEELKKIGFRRPQIVVWRDGEFEALGGDDMQTTTTQDVLSEFYRVEIEGMDETMDELVKEVIEKIASNKEIARIANENNAYIYTVGTFNSADEAQIVATAIGSVQDTIKASVVKVEN